jgi:uncharacterized membrane protein
VKSAHLWAIGYDNTNRAEEIRVEITKLAGSHCLVLLETAVAVRYADGCLTVDGEPCVTALDFRSNTFAGLLAGLALGAPPLTGAAVDALLKGTGGVAAEVGIGDSFITEVGALMKPGSSALFVLDQEGDTEALLQGTRGLGGTILKTNVDMNRARLIQSVLAEPSPKGRLDAGKRGST